MSRPVNYAALTEKRCSKCGTVKPVAEFNRYDDPTAALTGWRYYSWCRDCSNAHPGGVRMRWRRLVCRIIGHDPVRRITGIRLRDHALLFGIRFAVTDQTVSCRRCHRWPSPEVGRTPAAMRKGARW